MKTNLLTIKTIYSQLISIFKQNTRGFLSLVSGFFIILIVRMLLSIVDTIFIANEFPIQRIIFMLSTALLVVGLEMGYNKLIFNIIDNDEASLSTVFNYFNLLGQYIIGQLIYCLIVVVVCLPSIIYIVLQYGNKFFEVIYHSVFDPYFQELVTSYFNVNELFIILFLLLIPGIYIAIRLSFWLYFIIDKKLTGQEAIKHSWLLTKNKAGEILIIGLCLIVFNIIGLISIIGICFTAPVSYLFFCLYYRYLLANQE